MRYQKAHRGRTREHIVAQASGRFRRDGLAAVGVRQLMDDAGLTHGGFYGYFKSRSTLAAEAVAFALQDSRDALELAGANAERGCEFAAVVDRYLGTCHFVMPEQGCMAVALASEIGRADDDTKAAFRSGIHAVIAVFAKHLPGDGPPEERFGRAHAIYAMLLGSLQLALVTGDEARRAEILGEARRSALVLGTAL